MLTINQYSIQYTLATTALGMLSMLILFLVPGISPRALILYLSGYQGKH